MKQIEFNNVAELYNFYNNYKNSNILSLWEQLDPSVKDKIKVHKGMVGEIFEGLTGRIPNSNQEPDINNLGIDLKVIPVRELVRGAFTVKERSKITSINYSKLRNENWETSKVKYKSNILFNVYEVPHGCDFDDLDKMVFFGPILFFIDNTEHLKQIKGDWTKVQNIVYELKAHTLSTSITELLEASTSGSGAEKNYHPNAPSAIERSFSYKPRLLRLLFYESMGKYREKDTSEIFEDVDIFAMIKNNFANKSLDVLFKKYGIQYANNKSFIHQLIRKVLKISDDKQIRELHQNNISIKTVPLNPDNNKPWEAMSFPKISLADLVNEDWEVSENSNNWESPFKMQLMEEFILLPIYKKKIKFRGKIGFVDNRKWYFGEPKRWNFSERLIKKIGREWSVCKEMVVNDKVKTRRVPWGKSTRQENNLPKMSQTTYIHIRPHTSKSTNIDKPYRTYTSGKVSISWQSFWLNKDFVNKIINNNI